MVIQESTGTKAHILKKRARSSPPGKPREKGRRGRLGSVQREHVRLREVVGDVLCLYSPTTITKREYRAVIEVSSTNYALQSEEEQDAIIEGYRSFIKALTFPLQLLIRSQQLDLSAYLQQLTDIIEDETCEAAWKELATAHRSFVEALSQRRTLLQHRFYIILSPSEQEHAATPLKRLLKRSRLQAETFEDACQQLALRAESAVAALEAIGLRCHRLTGKELVDLEYSCWTPQRAMQHPLTSQVVEGVGRPKKARGWRPPRGEQATPRPLPEEWLPQAEEHRQSDGIPAVPPPDLLNLADLVAPASIEETHNRLCIEGEQVRCIAVTDFPREVSPGWIAPLILHDEVQEVVLHIHPQHAPAMVRRLMRKKAEFRSARRVNARRGGMDDPDAQVAEGDVEVLMGQLASGEERAFDVSLYVICRAPDERILDERTRRVMTVLDNLFLVARPAMFEHARAFRSFLPESRDELMRTCTLDSTSIATAFPFISTSLYMPGGVLEGVTANGEPVVIDDWSEELDNPHRFIGAITGAGKSYYCKLKITRELLLRRNLQVIVIDPEQEYRDTCAALGGDYIRVAPGSRQHINPFDLLPQGTDFAAYLADRSRGDRLAEKVQSLHALLDLMLADRGPGGVTTLSASEKGLLDRAMYEVYRKFGITADPHTHNRPVPLLKDLFDVLEHGEAGSDTYGLTDRLSRYVSGSLSGTFSAPTSVALSNRFVVFDVLDMSGELRPIGVWLIADFVWTQVLASHRPRVLYIDEAWSLISHPEGGRFLADLSRRARKRYLRLVTITQSPELFVTDEWGKVIAGNAATKVLKKQDRTSAQEVGKTFQLTRGEQQRLLTFGKPEALLLAGGTRVVLTVEANPLEHALATTDPREIEQRREHERFQQTQGTLLAREDGSTQDQEQPGAGPDIRQREEDSLAVLQQESIAGPPSGNGYKGQSYKTLVATTRPFEVRYRTRTRPEDEPGEERL